MKVTPARAAILFVAFQGCASREPLDPRHDRTIAADALTPHPAFVRLELDRGVLRIGARDGGHLVDGRIHVDDATLEPHVTINSRGVSIVQDFASDEGTVPTTSWDLTLGKQPLRLDVHAGRSEHQHVDLGARSIVSARFYNEAGHLELGWSAPNRIPAEQLELWSIRFIDAHDVARSRARRIEIKSVGRADIDLGTLIEPHVLVDVVSSAGALSVTVPADVTARATFAAGAGAEVEVEGWRAAGPRQYVLGAGSEVGVNIVVQTASGVVRLKTSPPRATR